MLGLDLDHLAVDGCITKAPCGGQTAGRSPVDRGKQGLKRSIVTEAAGIPLGAVPAGANPRDDGLRTNFHRQDLVLLLEGSWVNEGVRDAPCARTLMGTRP